MIRKPLAESAELDRTGARPFGNVFSARKVGSLFRFSLIGAFMVGKLLSAEIGQNTVVAWGSNGAGQCAVPPGLTNVVAIAAGGGHSLALLQDGRVVAWGDNSLNQTNVPVGLSGVVAISAGRAHSVALKSDGTVIAWGENRSARTNVPPSLRQVVAIASGPEHNLALKADGTVVTWGAGPKVPPDLTDVVAIAGGLSYSLALKRDGTVVGWGSGYRWPTNASGTIVLAAGLTKIVSLAAGDDYALALKEDGTLLPCRPGTVLPGLTDVVAVSARYSVSLALKRDRTVVAWGNNQWGQTNVPPQMENVAAIAAGYNHCLALIGRGAPFVSTQPLSRTIYAGESITFTAVAGGAPALSYQWQLNGRDILGATHSILNLADVQPEHVGNYTFTVSSLLGRVTSAPAVLTVILSLPIVAINPPYLQRWPGASATFTAATSGSLPQSFQWQHNGTNLDGAVEPMLNLTRLRVADSGHYQIIVSNPYGSVVSADAALTLVNVVGWGNNQYGQTTIPPDLTGIVAVAAGETHALALRHDGRILAWGNNVERQANVPAGLTDVVAISAGGWHSLALKQDETVIAWGDPSLVANVPPTLRRVVAIATGPWHNLALKSDGTVVAWGNSDYGKTAVPRTLTNAVAIAAGSVHSLALRADRTVVAWGLANAGITNIPPGLKNVVAIAAGNAYNLALTAKGTVMTWGSGGYVPQGLSNVVAIAARGDQNLALRADGTLVAWTMNPRSSTNYFLGPNVTAIATASSYSLALASEELPAPPELVNPTFAGDSLKVSVSTARGSSYRLEFSDALRQGSWTMLPPVPGDGTVRLLTDPAAPGPQRFYRVLQQP